jgi:hypothetical protein
MEVQPLEFARYMTYTEIAEGLNRLASEYPGLIEIESAGKTRQGRELYVAVITQMSSGAASSKPAMYIDGNHHAGEVTGSAACMYTIAYLLKNYGSDAQVTRLLDNYAFYILPRVSPDGSEAYLTTPATLRSTPRPWPYDKIDDGIIPEDIDGDGHILTMRVKDASGEFRISDKDARLMVRRRPDEFGGQYFRVYTEGYISGFDGAEVKNAPPRWGLDLNRNYPISWSNETKQPGSGPFPLSEPETRSVADFVASHRNIASIMSYHTSGGIILRPRCTTPDVDIPQADLAMFKALGRRGFELTGYPCKSIYEGFTVDKRKPSVGSFLDFAYDHLGIIAFATELWDLRSRAGIPDREPGAQMLLSELEDEEDGVKVLAWIDKETGGKGFFNWKKVAHPQLGEVEVGGVDPKFVRQNPPANLLHQECHKNMMFTLAAAMAMPKVLVASAGADALGDGVYMVSLVLENTGFMPSAGSDQALATKMARPVEATIILPPGANLIMGKERVEIANLAGRTAAGQFSATSSKKKVTWWVQAGKGAHALARIDIDAFRAGKTSVSVKLD